MKALVVSMSGAGDNLVVTSQLKNSDGTGLFQVPMNIPLSSITAPGSILTLLPTILNQWCTDNSFDVPNEYLWMIDPTVVSPSSPTVSAATRSLNTAFQVSSTKISVVNYSVDILTSVSLSGGAVGTVFLEYADQSGFTTGVTEIARFVNGNTGTLVVGLTLNQTSTAPLGGYVPAGKYVRIRTANTTGTPTFSYRSGQEVLV